MAEILIANMFLHSTMLEGRICEVGQRTSIQCAIFDKVHLISISFRIFHNLDKEVAGYGDRDGEDSPR